MRVYVKVFFFHQTKHIQQFSMLRTTDESLLHPDAAYHSNAKHLKLLCFKIFLHTSSGSDRLYNFFLTTFYRVLTVLISNLPYVRRYNVRRLRRSYESTSF